jgi:hypothetical protein
MATSAGLCKANEMQGEIALEERKNEMHRGSKMVV